MTTKKESSRDAPCTRRGREATGSFVDREEALIEVVCADCGRIEILRAEFERAEFEMGESAERRE